MSKGLQIAVGAGVVALLLGWVATTNLEGGGALAYYQTLAEFRAAGETGAARVHGFVVPGTIDRDLAARVVRFRVQNDPPHAGGGGGGALAVVYASLEVPDLFKDGAEVVVEGRLQSGASEFHATNVLAKCPSKFQARESQASL